jgi:hypothetical protein
VINKGLDKQDYIYMPKDKWTKGANRIITQLHAYISSIKSDPANKQHKARRLILIADNYSENKNNELFAWMNDLVIHNWFDSVECLFGEVGHTHSGDDATHNIHNNPCGNHESADLGQFIFNYPKTFSDTTCPEAHILDVVYNWKELYKPFLAPKMQGFTKTANDVYQCRGFRASRNKTNEVHFQWKVDPATDSDWRGQDGNPGTPGFFLLQRPSSGLPAVLPPAKNLLGEVSLNQLLKHGNYLQPYGVLAAARYNYDGVIPVSSILETSTPTGRWGPLTKIGSHPDYQGTVRFLRRVWWPGDLDDATDIWSLPSATMEQATSLRYHFSGDKALVEGRPLPYYNVRQVGTPAHKSGVYNHPNNTARRANGPVLLSMAGSAGGNDDEDQDPIPEQSGEWDKDEGEDVYVVDFDRNCKKNYYAVMLCKDKTTNKPFIEVAKVLVVDKKNKTFTGTKHACTKDPNSNELMSGQERQVEPKRKRYPYIPGICRHHVLEKTQL